MKPHRIVLIAVIGALLLISLLGLAQPADSTHVSPVSAGLVQGGLPNNLILIVLSVSLAALALFWIAALCIFAYRDQLELVTRLTRSGLVLKLVTVVAIIAIIFILRLLGRIESDQTTTVLASIAGYVLGETVSNGRTESPEDSRSAAPSSPPPPGIPS